MRWARAPLVLVTLAASFGLACTSEADLGSWAASGPGEPLHNQPGASDAAAVNEPHDRDAAYGSDAMLGQAKSPLCLRNPSLDGIPHGGPADPGVWWPPEAWDSCFNDAADFPDPAMPGTALIGPMCVSHETTIDPKDGAGARPGFLPAATHGVGYLYLDTLRELPERTSQTMCGTLEAGVTYNFAIDLASRVGQVDEGTTLAAGALEIFGTNTVCGHAGEPLWRSPPLTRGWAKHCVSITPEADTTVLTLQLPTDRPAKAAIMIDNIRLDASCGPAVVAR